MRAPSTFALSLGTALATALSFAACADALHLDPAGSSTTSSAHASSTGTSTGTSSSSGGTGGSSMHDGGMEAGAPCKSNGDCPYPTPVCNEVTRVCVQCLVISDCEAMPGTVCSLGQCICPAPPSMPLTYCAGESPACIDTTSSSNNCGSCGHTCYGGCSASKCPSPWSQIPVSSSTPQARSNHVAIWTGSKMFVWGGKSGGTALAGGGLFDPATSTWKTVSTMNAPSPRWDATAVWDDVDNKIVIWGGTTGGTSFPQDGGIYDPATDNWTPTSMGNNLPQGRSGHTAIWVHSLMGFPPSTSGMIIFGGAAAPVGSPPSPYLGDGQVFDPSVNAWLGQLPTGPSMLTPRALHVATWDGARMLIYGGVTTTLNSMMNPVNTAVGDAYIFNPMTMAWNTLSGLLPTPRWSATGLYDPMSMQSLVWGGFDGLNYHGDGAELTSTMMWNSIGAGTTTPPGRINHSGVIMTVSGKSQMAIFGGFGGTAAPYGVLGDGWTLDIASSAWTEIPMPGPPSRRFHSAVSTGSTMIVWGGEDPGGGPLQDGAIYAP